MDKENMNLEQLYKERFHSFEMEQSSNINMRMKQKIKYAKTMQLIKWIAIAVLTTAAVATIAFLSLNSDDSQTQTDLPKTQSTIETIEEKSKPETDQISITEEKQTKETKSVDKAPLKTDESQRETTPSILSTEMAEETSFNENEFQN